MDLPEVRQMTDAELRAWDWMADLVEQERTQAWLARKTDRSQAAVNRFARGSLAPSLAWLRSAARVLGRAA